MTKLKVGMVSFAHSTHPERYLSALMRNPHVEVVGISDPDTARARHHADQYGLPLYSSHTELMDLCQAVVISSEYNAHRELIEQATARNCETYKWLVWDWLAE